MRKLLLLLASASVLAAGCGGGGGGSSTTTATAGPPLTKAEYQAKLAEIAREVGSQLGTSSQEFSKLTDEQVSTLVDALHSFAGRLEAVNPPVAVKALHARLILAINDLAAEFPGIAHQLKGTKDPSKAIGILFGAKGIQELIALGTEFEKAGYTLKLA